MKDIIESLNAISQSISLSADAQISPFPASPTTTLVRRHGFTENTLLMFSNPYQPRINSTLSSLLSLLNDKKVHNVAKHRMQPIDCP